MASFFYDEARQIFGGEPTHSQPNFETGVFGMFFVDEGADTISQSADVDAADRTAGAQVPSFATAPNIANPTWTVTSNIGIFDGDDLTFTALSGAQSESVDLFLDTGTDTTSPMIANFDDYTGLPLTPSGSDVVIVFHANGIFRV
jgi:hypothetical protein